MAKQYEMMEFVFSGTEMKENYAKIDLKGEFLLNGKTTLVEGFYDGKGVYKIRYLPLEKGLCSYKISGLFSKKGQFQVKEGKDHGPVKAEETHFVFSDKTQFIPVGTTVYALAHQSDEVVNQTLSSLKRASFNKVRMCVFPKYYEYNHREPPFYPFQKKVNGTWDLSSPDTDFWHRFEDILKRIIKLGIEIDLILFHPYDNWGFSKFSMPDNFAYLDYLLRRLGSWPHIWWSLANEYDLIPSMQYDDWEKIQDYIFEHEPFEHLMGIHQCFMAYDHSKPHITHCSIQSATTAQIPELLAKYHKPVIYDEMCYEGNIESNWGNISAFEETNRFWQAFASGGYATHGETFNSPDEILWWAAGGTLKGQSWKRIKFLRKVIESIPGPLSPNLQSAGYIGKIATMSDEEFNKMVETVPAEYRTFALRLRKVNPVDLQLMMIKDAVFSSSYKDEAYLTYFSIHCPFQTKMSLPKDKKYTVDVIDVWQMNRKTVLTHVSGDVVVPLLSKEGIAVLAIKE
ncbi:MAG: DUF4038 domain-containing protein [Bacilli bacterium]|jgi:hypothetical protein|nr:DUF4038 domain-containing protein [Bacilli bacterium]